MNLEERWPWLVEMTRRGGVLDREARSFRHNPASGSCPPSSDGVPCTRWLSYSLLHFLPRCLYTLPYKPAIQGCDRGFPLAPAKGGGTYTRQPGSYPSPWSLERPSGTRGALVVGPPLRLDNLYMLCYTSPRPSVGVDLT